MERRLPKSGDDRMWFFMKIPLNIFHFENLDISHQLILDWTTWCLTKIWSSISNNVLISSTNSTFRLTLITCCLMEVGNEEKLIGLSSLVGKCKMSTFYHLIGQFSPVLNTDWLTFCTIGLATLTISDGIVNTLNNVCEILAESADGISASIKFEVFRDVYTYLSERFVDL